MADGEPKVEYSVKDRLAIQDKTLERIEGKLDQVTLDQVRSLAVLDTRVALLEQRPNLEERVNALESEADQSRGARDSHRFLWPTFATFVGASSWLPHFIRI